MPRIKHRVLCASHGTELILRITIDHVFGIGGKGDFLAVLDLWLVPSGFYFELSGDCLLFGSFGKY